MAQCNLLLTSKRAFPVHNYVHETGSHVTAHYTTSCSVHVIMRVMKGGEKSKSLITVLRIESSCSIGGPTMARGGPTVAAVHGPGDHWWRRVWSGQTTCGADHLRRDSPHCQKSSFKIKLFYYCGVLLVLNHCSNHHKILSTILILLEKTDFVIHVINF